MHVRWLFAYAWCCLCCRLNFVAAVVTAAGLGITFYSTGFETGGIQSRSAGSESSLLVVVMRMPVCGRRITHDDSFALWCRLGCLFFILLYLSMMALGSLPVWRQEGLLFHR